VQARWPANWPNQSRQTGATPDEVRPLVEYWRDGYDWRANEAQINTLQHRLVDVNHVPIHFVEFPGESLDAMPIVLTHGWPSTFLELTSMADRLSNPSRYGGQSRDAFTVIVPSLPGYGFSPQRSTLPPDLPTHEIWHQLMHDKLGFTRYAAHGGDLGAGITARLGQAHPESVIGIHVLAVANPPAARSDHPTTEEQQYLGAVAAWAKDESAYMHQQQTRPLTLSYGLSDSPVGLLAWLVEKYRAWSDNNGDVTTRFTADFLLTQVSLYWFTNTISTSFRPYFENNLLMNGALDRVTVPTAVAVFPQDLAQPPRSWAERLYNVQRYTPMPRGGHFAAHEEPELLAKDLTAFFSDLR
jgi:pimeloyl-ACP methyl ester carboxylesterase